MQVFVDGEEMRAEAICSLKSKTKVQHFLECIGMNRESVIVKANGRILTENDCINPGDRIDLIRVSSGG